MENAIFDLISFLNQNFSTQKNGIFEIFNFDQIYAKTQRKI